MATPTDNLKRHAVPVFVASTVMLTFISFWRAAAIVLSDLASSAYYAGGDAENVIGKSAPWFILAVMLFTYAIRAVYMESSSMFVRGGVYRVVKQAMGGTLAKFSVSALLFDYVLTGPISSVAAGQYASGLVKDFARYAHVELAYNDNYFAAVFAIGVTVYFWWQNTKGMHESSEKAMKIMKTTTVMVVVLLIWCVATIVKSGVGLHFPPLPTMANFSRGEEAWGWLHGTSLMNVPLLMLMVGFGHSVLAGSGFETLAQVNREIEHPKLVNLKRAGMVIFVYSLIFTTMVSFFSVMLIPDATRPKYFSNLIVGLTMFLAGPMLLKLIFSAFVVVVGALILSGAVNTSIVGASGVLNRICEDGVLTPWFQRPHKRFGTSYRIVNLIVGLQIITIIATRGNVYFLAALYAFGVVWSFSMNALAVLVLRYTHKEGHEWKVPGNFFIRGVEVPVGLLAISVVLFATALTNFVTKPHATVAGVSFSAVLFVLFAISERYSHRQTQGKEQLDQFRVFADPELTSNTVGARPGNILVAVRDPRNLYYLRHLLQHTDTTKQDVVVLTSRITHREHSFSGHAMFEAKDIFDNYEQELFTRVIAVAEKEGKTVKLLVVPGTNVFDTLMVTAQDLESSRVVCGLSNKLTADEQGKLLGDAWERIGEPKPRLTLEVVAPDGTSREYLIGPHTPRLRDEDLALMHKLWLEITSDPHYSALHHYHIVSLALKELQRELHDTRRQELLDELRAELAKREATPPNK